MLGRNSATRHSGSQSTGRSLNWYSRVRSAAIVLATLIGAVSAPTASAQQLAEFLFWDSLGNTIDQGARAHAEYRAERELWQDKIAAAKADLAACGGCAAAQAELDRWQRVENDFQQVAGDLAFASGMPPAVANWLGIDMPMTRGFTDAEREAMRFQRPAWIDERPAFCRAPSEAFVSCMTDFQSQYGLTATVEVASEPGAVCRESYRLFAHCRAENYEGFEREQAVQEARANGKIIAEYSEEARIARAYFGEVANDFVPRYPDAELVRSELARSDIGKVSYIFRKRAAGRFGGFEVENFYLGTLSAVDYCDTPEETAARGELGRRICEDIFVLRVTEPRQVLTCQYTKEGGAARRDRDEHVYWYDLRPEIADVSRLLARSNDHPMLAIGEARTTCPETRNEAQKIDAAYLSMVQSQRRRTPQTPASEVLPESELLRKQQEEYERRGAEIAAQRETMQEMFSSGRIAGVYNYTIGYGASLVNGSCILVQWRNNQFQLNAACRSRDGETLVLRGDMDTTTIRFAWPRRGLPSAMRDNEAFDLGATTMNVSVGLQADAPGAADQIVLEGGLSSQHASRYPLPAIALMQRVDDLPQIDEYVLLGGYRMELKAGADTVQADCAIYRDGNLRGLSYKARCRTPDGMVRNSNGRRHQTDQHTIQFSSWYPDRFRVGGDDATDMFLLVEPGQSTSSGGQPSLTGYAGSGTKLQLTPSPDAVQGLDIEPELLVVASTAGGTGGAGAPARQPGRVIPDRDVAKGLASTRVMGVELGMSLVDAERVLLSKFDGAHIADGSEPADFTPFRASRTYSDDDFSEMITLFLAPDVKRTVVAISHTVPAGDETITLDGLKAEYGAELTQSNQRGGLWARSSGWSGCRISDGVTRLRARNSYVGAAADSRPAVPTMSARGYRAGAAEPMAEWADCGPIAGYSQNGRGVRLNMYDLGLYASVAPRQ